MTSLHFTMALFDRDSRIRNSLVALSLANVCFLSVWRELLFVDATDSYWIPDYTPETYLAIIINVFALTLIIYVLIHYVFRCSWPWLAALGRLIFLVMLLLPLSYLRRALELDGDSIQWLIDYWWISLPVSGAFGLVGFYLLVFCLRWVTQIVGIVFLIFSPFALMNLANAAWSGIRLESAAPLLTTPPQQQPNSGSKQRILWLLMDELDLDIAFIERSKSPALPEFDRFRKQAFFARSTISYSQDTKEAIPSFLLQKVTRHAEPTGPADLRLKFMDFEHAPDANFSSLPNFFEDVAARGAKTAIVGYYHPYCRLFFEDVVYCHSYAVDVYSSYHTENVLEELWSQILGITPLFAGKINAIKTYERMSTEFVRLAADPSFDIIYVHASVPHHPHIGDPETKSTTVLKFSPFYALTEGYFGNLILADRMLGAARASMERAGLWDSTAVLVTSDHGWRHLGASKIPFVLKMPGQKVQFEFLPSFAPMRVTKDLLLGILDRELVTPEAVGKWLQSRINAQGGGGGMTGHGTGR